MDHIDTRGRRGGDDDSTEFSCYNAMGISIATISSAVMVMNILHMVIITKMPSLRGRPYRWVLIHIALADIGTALTLIAVYSCMPIVPVINKLARGVRPALALVHWPQYTSHWIFLFASIEQYYGICKPLRHSASCFVQKINWVMTLTWPLGLCCTVSIAALRYVSASHSATLRTGVLIADLIVRYAPLFLAGIPLTLILKNLRQKRERSLTRREKELRRSSVYLIIIHSIFITLSLIDWPSPSWAASVAIRCHRMSWD